MTSNPPLGIRVTPGRRGQILVDAEDVYQWMLDCANTLSDEANVIGAQAVAEEFRDFWIEAAHRVMDGSL